MIKRKLLIFLLIASIFMGGTSAYPYELWNKTFGGTNIDYTESVQQTSDGGYILAGITSSFGAGEEDAWLIKTDANGVEQWNKTFGGTSYDEAYSVLQTPDGGYILAGTTSSFGRNGEDYDAWLIKTDANGVEQWNKTFGGISYDEANSVLQTPDGGYILAGTTSSFDVGGIDAWVIKTDANGAEQWNRTFGEAFFDFTFSVLQTPDGGYILAGTTSSFGGNGEDNDAWLIKTDVNGTEQWNRTFGGTSYGEARSVQQTSDGGYILAGTTLLFDENDDGNAWLIKTNINGTEQWNKTFGGIYYDEARSVQQTPDEGFILAGFTQSFVTDEENEGDAWVIKTDANGTEQWNKTFGGILEDDFSSVLLTSDGNYIFAGSTGIKDAWLVKVSSETVRPIDTCTLISSPGEYKLTMDIIDIDDPCCIEITSNDIIFDGAGYTIDGDSNVTYWNYGLRVNNSTNVTVKNLNLTDWKFGIYYLNSDKGTIINNSAPSKIRGTGILVDSSNAINLTNNSVSNRTYGIKIVSSNDIYLANNSASNHCYLAIELTNSSNNTLENNLVSNNTWGFYIINSFFNTLTDNIAKSNMYYGIDLINSSFNTLTDNLASNNTYGIYLGNSSFNTLINNMVASSDFSGIDVRSSNNNTIANNNASNNDYGIHLYDSNNNNLTGNTANFNNHTGVFLANSSSNNLTNNSAIDNLQWDFYSNAGSINYNVINFNIGPRISFTGKDVKIKAASSPASDPSGYHSINKYINATNSSADSWLFLNVSYDDNDVIGVKENTLQMWKNNGTWSQISGTNGVNTAQNYVYANITSFSVFAPMADLSPASITNLRNITYAPTYIKWIWTDPDEPDFEKVMVSIDQFRTNVSKGVQYYYATGLNSSTDYTISTNTVDNEGNINQTPVINTSKTAPPPDFNRPINITILSPDNESIDTTGNVTVTVVLDRVGTALLNWNGKNESMEGGSTYFYKHKKDLLSGNFNIKVYAIDSKGVTSVSETRILTVNRTKIINLSIDRETGIVDKTNISISPSGNVIFTIFIGTNVSGCDKAINNILMDSKDQLDPELGQKLDPTETFLGENLSVLPDCAVFSQDIQLQFNYTDEQLEAAGIDESNLVVKFYNDTKSKWEDIESYEHNESLNYIKINVNHFCYFSLVARVPSSTPSREIDQRRNVIGTSGEAFGNILISETERESVYKDAEVIYSFDMDENIVQQIKFKSLTNSGDVVARVEILKDTSTLVKNPPPDIIYKNLNILVGTAGWATSKNIVEPAVHFKVEKIWIFENNIDESTIRLNRYNNGIWNPLITSKIYEDADNLYFKGKTNEFSFFAVSGKNILAKPGGLGEEVAGEEFPVRTSSEKNPVMPGFSFLIGLLLLLITAHIFQKK